VEEREIWSDEFPVSQFEIAGVVDIINWACC